MPADADSAPEEPEARLTPEQRAKAESLIEAMESRTRQAETFAWAVPGLALTSQALLLTVAFNPDASDSDASDSGRAAAAFSATAILLAALHFLGKHSFNI
jgi:hypothetical protein